MRMAVTDLRRVTKLDDRPREPRRVRLVEEQAGGPTRKPAGRRDALDDPAEPVVTRLVRHPLVAQQDLTQPLADAHLLDPECLGRRRPSKFVPEPALDSGE